MLFSPNTGKYGPEITPYLDTFHAVLLTEQFCYVRPIKVLGVANILKYSQIFSHSFEIRTGFF